jgi:hypothetical protein
VRFVTDAHGFRARRRARREAGAGRVRALLVGDSFAAGYRIGQEESPGAVLERALAPAEVATARLDDRSTPGIGSSATASTSSPTFVVLLVTTANDAAGAWLHLDQGGEYEVGVQMELERRPGPALSASPPPRLRHAASASAFANRNRLSISLDAARDKLSRLRLLAPLAGSGAHTGAAAWYGDLPGRVHALDLMHGLGLYLARDVPHLVVEAEERLAQAVVGASAAARAAAASPWSRSRSPHASRSTGRTGRRPRRATRSTPASFDLERPRRELARRLGQESIPTLDLAPAFRAAAARGERLFLPRGDMHWSARGATLAGETLADLLRAGGFAP